MELIKIKHKFEVNKINELIPDFLHDMSLEYNFVIAGGMITSIFNNSEVNDIDIYLTKKEDLLPFVYELKSNATIVSVTDKSLLVNHSGKLINLILFDLPYIVANLLVHLYEAKIENLVYSFQISQFQKGYYLEIY